MAAIELVKDRDKLSFFDPADKIGERVFKECRARGVFTRVRGDALLFAPPLVTTEEQIDRLADVAVQSIRAVCDKLPR